MKRRRTKLSPSSTDTLIGEATVVEGKVICQASLRIEGKVLGDIECEGDVTIGHQGEVESNILARNVIAAGKVSGSVTALEMLTITETGKVNGSIHVGSILIAQGGIFEGTSIMDGKNEHTEHPRNKKNRSEESSKASSSKVEKLAAAK